MVLACGNSQSGSDGGATTLPDGRVINGTSPTIASCAIFPPDNPWNRDVSGDKLRSDSDMFIANMAPSAGLHPDWGTFTEQYGIPYNTGAGAPPVKMTWTASYGAKESDPLACPNAADGNFCYPVPSSAKIEGGPGAKTSDDRHLLYIDTQSCTLYELYNAQNWTGPDWKAANGAIWHLGSNALRTIGWTSADAAGLPVLPGLVRFDEVMSGEIKHAIRFTMVQSQQAYIKPATHAAGKMNASLPPMGLRVRLKASYAPAQAPSKEAQVIITALKKYGMLLADNGSNWYLSGETHDGWSQVIDGILSALGKIHGSDFEVVDTGPIETAGLN